MTAKNDLKRYKALYYEVKYLKREIEEMYNTVRAVNYDEKTGGGNADDLTLAVVEHILKRKENFEKKLKDLYAEEERILNMIHQIDNAEIQRVMILRYINFKPWAKIEQEMNYSEAGIMKLHRQGLVELDSKVQFNK